MTLNQVKERLVSIVDVLPPDKAQLLLNFADFLKQQLQAEVRSPQPPVPEAEWDEWDRAIMPLRFPSAIFPTRLRGGGLFNLLSHVAGGQTFWQLMRPLLNDARRELLDLPPTPLLGPFMDMLRQGLPVLYGYSPSVLPKPPDWAGCLHVVG
ncbi:MAG: hypothetical protein HY784_08760, partial [Chloroflexi bacterium]|nr:hypothetical protein [Chloroflexota bacterium]